MGAGSSTFGAFPQGAVNAPAKRDPRRRLDASAPFERHGWRGAQRRTRAKSLSSDKAGIARGFTLVEVLVALLIMSIMALMAWQGVDGISRAREITRDRAERTLRLQTAIAQWEQDLGAVQDEQVVPALSFDGATFRLTRRTPDGMQTVAWAIRAGGWWRWAGPVTTRATDLQQQWFASQQLLGNEPQQLRVLAGISRWQVYCFRGAGWSNCQSSSDVVPAAAPQPGAASAPRPAQRVQLPTGVRLELSLASGGGASTLVRDVALAPQLP